MMQEMICCCCTLSPVMSYSSHTSPCYVRSSDICSFLLQFPIPTKLPTHSCFCLLLFPYFFLPFSCSLLLCVALSHFFVVTYLLCFFCYCSFLLLLTLVSSLSVLSPAFLILLFCCVIRSSVCSFLLLFPVPT